MTNKTVFLRWCAALLVLLTATACMQGVLGVGAAKGRVAIAVKWPKKAAFAVQMIPEDTAKIDVVILSPDGTAIRLPEPMRPNGDDTSTEFLDVPIGPKVVQATAYDVNDVPLASGESAPFNVLPNVLVEARVVLTEKPFPKPGESPSPDPQATPTTVPGAGDLIFTVAGDGAPGAFDAGDPLQARFRFPQALAYDAERHAVYVADTGNKLVRRFNLTTSAVLTFAGTPSTVADASPSPAASAPAALGSALGRPTGLAVGPGGMVYVSDPDHQVIRVFAPDGVGRVFAGTGRPGFVDGAVATESAFNRPMGLAAGRDGAVYVADTLNHAVRRISPAGFVTTLAGTGAPGHSGDSGRASEAQLNAPIAVALDPQGEFLYIAEFRHVRRVHLGSGVINTVVGNGQPGSEGEGGPAIAANLTLPLALAFDAEARLLIAEGWLQDTGLDLLGMTSRVLRLNADGTLHRVAGQRTKAYGFAGDGGPPRAAELNNPSGLAVDRDGLIYIADTYNNRLRAVRPAPKPTPAPTPAPSATPTPSPSASPLAP